MKILIQNGHVVDPTQEIDGIRDILIKGRKIEGLYPKGKGPDADKTIDASKFLVLPGLVIVGQIVSVGLRPGAGQYLSQSSG